MIVTMTRFICDACEYREDHAGVGPGLIRQVREDGWHLGDRDLCFACAAEPAAIETA